MASGTRGGMNSKTRSGGLGRPPPSRDWSRPEGASVDRDDGPRGKVNGKANRGGVSVEGVPLDKKAAALGLYT